MSEAKKDGELEKTCNSSTESSQLEPEPEKEDVQPSVPRKADKPAGMGGIMAGMKLPTAADLPPEPPQEKEKEKEAPSPPRGRTKKSRDASRDNTKEASKEASKEVSKDDEKAIEAPIESEKSGKQKKPKKKKSKKKSKQADPDAACEEKSGRASKDKESAEKSDRHVRKKGTAPKIKDKDEQRRPDQQELEKNAAFREKLQKAYNFLVQEPDASVAGALYYHGYAEPSYVRERLGKIGEYLLCKIYREVDNKGRIIELLCIALHGPSEIGYFTIMIGPNKQFFLGTKGFDNINQLVSHFASTGEPLPNKDTAEAFIMRKSSLRQNELIAHEQVTLKEEVGAGEFGAVYKGIYTGEKEPITVAVKSLKDLLSSDPVKKQKFLLEAYIMMKIRPHKNITQIFGICTLKNPLYIVLEFMPKGSLKSYLKKTKDVTDEAKLSMLLGAAAGLAHLEEAGIVHRDIAARNCLMAVDGSVKISDFGLSMEEKVLKNKSTKLEPVPLPTKWLAPEVLKHYKFSVKSDVWAFGVMICEVYTNGGDPYPGMTNKEVKKLILETKGRMPVPKECPKYMHKVLDKCWAEAPQDRKSFKRLTKYMEFSRLVKTGGSAPSCMQKEVPEHSVSLRPTKKKRPAKSTTSVNAGVSTRQRRPKGG
ncbi:unnamed protein product, partial [Mesorhabditis spiculigera]